MINHVYNYIDDDHIYYASCADNVLTQEPQTILQNPRLKLLVRLTTLEPACD